MTICDYVRAEPLIQSSLTVSRMLDGLVERIPCGSQDCESSVSLITRSKGVLP